MTNYLHTFIWKTRLCNKHQNFTDELISGTHFFTEAATHHSHAHMVSIDDPGPLNQPTPLLQDRYLGEEVYDAKTVYKLVDNLILTHVFIEISPVFPLTGKNTT